MVFAQLHGLGFLQERCQRMPNENIFSVHYSRVALITSLAGTHATRGLWEPDYRRTENFELGYNARYENLKEAYYWEAV